MKVYCSNCKHFNKYEGCLHLKHMVDSPYSRRGGDILLINSQNNCAEHEKAIDHEQVMAVVFLVGAVVLLLVTCLVWYIKQ